MTDNYMKICLRDFGKVCEQQFNCQPDFEKIENEFRRFGEMSASADDLVATITQYTQQEWFRPYWILPAFDKFKSEKKYFNFALLVKKNEGKRNEKMLIAEMLGVFRHIEIVSIFLRFIHPYSFGMITPPVMSILDLQSAESAVETYCNYLRNIREIRDKYKGIETAAEADMALWVLQHKCNPSGRDEEIEKQFYEDEVMLSMRLENSAIQFDGVSSARIAKAFRDVDKHLATLIGCYSLEENLKEWVKVIYGEKKLKDLVDRKASLDEFYNEIPLKTRKSVLNKYHFDFEELKKIRNQMFHANTRECSKSELNKIIRFVLRIESDIQSRK